MHPYYACTMHYTWIQRVGFGCSVGLAAGCGPNVETNNNSEGVATDDTNATDNPGIPSNPSSPATTGQSSTGSAPSDDAQSDGLYLFALSPSISPDTPFQFLAEVTVTDGAISFDMQPLSLDQGSTTTPREPIGDSFLVDSTPLEDGRFSVELANLRVDGGANPITGAPIVANILLSGRIDSADFLCGTADGDVAKPVAIPLTGSTFGAVRIDDTLELPPPLFSCTQ